MNKWKKTLASVLTAALLLGLVPTVALAAAGELILEPTEVYAQVYNFDESDTAQVRDTDWNPMTVTVKDGKVSAAAVAGGKLTAFWDEKTDLVGFKDGAGKVVIPAVYDYADMSEVTDEQKVIPVQNGEKWGLIDKAGKTVVDFTYDYLYFFYEDRNYISCQVGEKSGVLDGTGKVVLPAEYDTVYSIDTLADGKTVFQAAKDGKDGVVDTANHVVVPFRFDLYTLGSFSGGTLAPFGVADASGQAYQYGYIDSTGKEVVAPAYGYASSFVNGLALVSKDSKYGYIDVAGKEVIPCGFTDAYVFSDDGVAVVEDKDYNCALIDKTGKLLTGFDYSLIETDEDNGLHLASKWNGSDTVYGYLDTAGKEVIDFIYADANAFSNGLAVVAMDNGTTVKQGIIDEKGGVVLPCAYDKVGGAWVDEAPLFASDYVWVANFDDIIYNYKYGVVRIDRAAASGTAPAAPVVPETATAVPTSYPVLVDGKQVDFDVYAIKDEKGNDTNYFKLRDLASVLNGTKAQFQVGWDGSVTITTGTAYTANGTEMSTPFSGPQPVSGTQTTTRVNGAVAALDTIVLKDAAGNGYTYYKLRDLGEAIGVTVDWDQAAGSIVISTEG